jgi:serine/threonine protein kinase/beta-lactam-binding protein with PASTA domain
MAASGEPPQSALRRSAGRRTTPSGDAARQDDVPSAYRQDDRDQTTMTTPRLLSERYELGETLGYGGMSEVHRGFDTRLGRDVAVKVLRADLARDPQFQIRFRREAQNAAALNHPAIVAVYDTGEISGEGGPLPYIVMEYVDGQTLREIVKTQGPLSQQKVIEVMADVCAALDFSHRHQIIHRDVKPANVMINHSGAVKVMDFGIARALGEGQNVTQTAAVIGTAQYLSPEQARGEPVDARSDVYAAGCVLYELLTGEPPFTGDTPVAVAYQHVREDPKRPSEVNPDVPPALDAVVLKALSKNPANRYQSAAEMRSDLVRVRSGEAPLAPMVMSEEERTALLTDGSPPTRRLNGSRRATPARQWNDEDRRGGGRNVLVGFAVVTALALVSFVAWLILSDPPAPEQFALPDVVGQEQEAARATLLNAKLQPRIEQVASEVAQEGKVVGTDPPAGTQIAERAQVVMRVGTGPAQATVPRLIGRTATEAEPLLVDAGLKLGQKGEEPTSDATKIGKIVRSDPEPGESVAGDTAVSIFIGVEPQFKTVPDVTGDSPDEAEATLESAGFRVQRSGDGDEVFATNPAAGEQVAEGSTVTLQLSPTGDFARVPNVIGERIDDAQAELEARGFTASVSSVETNDPSKFRRVIQQSPSGGADADTSRPVRLVVGLPPGLGSG